MKRPKSTLKLKIDLRPGAKLSSHFNNSRGCYKVIETDQVVGYVVSRGGRDSAAMIYPLNSASIYMKVGGVLHVVSSFEQGDRLNEGSFHVDYQGCTLAMIAAQAIAALEERRSVHQPVRQVKSKKRGRR